MKKTSSWLLLMYGLSGAQASARVNLWRKLKRFGAVQLKTSAYLLPDEPLHYERFQWLAGQIQDAGGEATLVRAAEIEGLTYDRIARLFNDARRAEYKDLMDDIRKRPARKGRNLDSAIAKLEKFQRRFNEIREIDYFGCSTGHEAEMLLQSLERETIHKARPHVLPKLSAAEFIGTTWLTRPRPGIDRAGSAWLIRRFIDPKARFIFGMNPEKYPRALPFDMVDTEFSHHGDDCTFETLVKRFGVVDKAVTKIAEMVHDADLEDGKYQRVECLGIDAVLRGWEKMGWDDNRLLDKGAELFEALFQQLRK